MTTMQINTDIMMHPGNMGRLLDVKIKIKVINKPKSRYNDLFIIPPL